MYGIKIGRIEIVSVYLDQITNPVSLVTSEISPDWKYSQVGNDYKDQAKCVWIKKYGGAKSGNVNNCKRGRQNRRRKSARY